MTEASFDDAFEALAAGDVAKATVLIDDLRSRLDRDAPATIRSRAARASATARRLAGDLEGAFVLVDQALAIAAEPGNDDPVPAIEGELELADLLAASGRQDEATQALGRAERLADRAVVPDVLRWQVTLRTARHELGVDPARAVARLDELVAGLPDVPEGALSTLSDAQRALLLALDHLAAGDDAQAALAALHDAAALARRDEDVAAYTGARIAIAHVLEEEGDRVGAYRSLAMGWATLRAALGIELARDAFLPMMRQCRDRWGDDEFARVKAAVEGG